jgi:hypothetical protein
MFKIKDRLNFGFLKKIQKYITIVGLQLMIFSKEWVVECRFYNMFFDFFYCGYIQFFEFIF